MTETIGLAGRMNWRPGVVSETLRCELFPEDLTAAVEFYVTVLGFEVVGEDRGTQASYLALERRGGVPWPGPAP